MDILFQDNGNYLDDWLDALRQALPGARIRVWQGGDDAPADYAIVWKPAHAMLRGRTGLKAIFSRGAGVDGIFQSGAALPPGVPVIRLDDAGMGVQMAEYTAYALLRYFRRFDQYEVQRQAGQWRFLPPYEKRDFSVGVLGLGVLGMHVVRAVQHFGFPLHGWSRSPKQIDGVHCHAGADGLPDFLRACRVLICILPLTAETRGILNRATLAQLPRGAYLINVARGAHVVEADLLGLVQEGHLAGATLDVFDSEPLPAAHPFWREPRICITPHMAAMSLFGESARQIAGKIAALEQGRPVNGVVDILKGY